MFKKKQGKKSNLRRRNNEDDGDDDHSSNGSENGADGSTHAQIQQKKKRRMILESLQYRKGISATKLLQKNPSDRLFLDQQTEEPISDDPNKREGVLEQKHRLAMEEYIEENLGASDVINNKEDTAGNRKDGSMLNATEKLYAQLSEAAARLAGRSTDSRPIDADVGAGGGLSAGTGLAEVLLPVEERMATLEATARAARKQSSSDTDMMKRLPSSKLLHTNPVPSRFSAPSRQKVPSDTVVEQEGLVIEDSSENARDSDRVGFQAFRRQQAGETGSRHSGNSHERGGGHRATDDRAFKNFVTKQRERRQNR